MVWGRCWKPGVSASAGRGGLLHQGPADYQFRQTGQDSFEMLVETVENADRDMIQAEMLRQMKEILREKSLDYVAVLCAVCWAESP